MDVVYVCRDGENPELRYSLRTLKNVNHDRVWLFGGAPSWINPDTVTHEKRMQHTTRFIATRNHIKAACDHPEVSDPFMLWNDDFFAMDRIGTVPVYHRGSLYLVLEEYGNSRTPWAKGLRETIGWMKKNGFLNGVMSYDLHMPLIVHKAEMLEAIRLVKATHSGVIHLRTIYGVTACLGGVGYVDPKMYRRNEPFPHGPWLSSSPESFRYAVEPVLRYLFPEPCCYERHRQAGQPAQMTTGSAQRPL